MSISLDLDELDGFDYNLLNNKPLSPVQVVQQVVEPPVQQVQQVQQLMLEEFVEPLIDPKLERLRSFPVKYQDIWDAYIKHKAMHWTFDEIGYSKDQQDFMYYPQPVQRLLKYALAFFASSDFLVNKLVRKHKYECTWPEVLAYLANKENREVEHNLTYGKLILVLVKNEEAETLFEALETMPIIRKKADYMMQYSEGGLAGRLVSDAINEGIFFSGLFCIILFCKKRFGGKTPGLYLANDFILRDETDHRDFACLLYRKYVVKKLSPEECRKRITNAVKLECEFITEAFETDIIGLSCAEVCQYIQFVADTVWSLLGYNGYIYGTKNPFNFMAKMSLPEKTDFFSGRGSNYSATTALIENDPTRAHENDMGLDDI